MKLSWTFFPEPNTSVTLTVHYVPELDAEDVPSGGFLDVGRNTAYVNWPTYKQFDSVDVKARKDAFGRLAHLAKGGGVILQSGTRIVFTEFHQT